MKKELLLYTKNKEFPEGGIHFTTSKDSENINLFPRLTISVPEYNFSHLKVYVNGELTNQAANSISAKANDDIIIYTDNGKYPELGYWSQYEYGSYDINYIKSIEEPLPLLYDKDSNPIDNFDQCFMGCTSLISIPSDLFGNNPQVQSVVDCFTECTGLTSIPNNLFTNNTQIYDVYGCFTYCTKLATIPAGLFDNNPQIDNIGYCFMGCTSLTSVPDGLFDNLHKLDKINGCFAECSNLTAIPIDLFDKVSDELYDAESCFRNCSKLVPVVQIGTKNPDSTMIYTTNFAAGCAAKGTVYCKEGSGIYYAFLYDDSANVNVLTY